MKKFIPYEKLSKKARRALDTQKRGSWGALKPLTRRSPNLKAYNRKKARKWRDELQDRAFFLQIPAEPRGMPFFSADLPPAPGYAMMGP